MAKLDQIDKRLKHSEDDRDVMKKELRYNKHEYLDSYFNLAKATEEKLSKNLKTRLISLTKMFQAFKIGGQIRNP